MNQTRIKKYRMIVIIHEQGGRRLFSSVHSLLGKLEQILPLTSRQPNNSKQTREDIQEDLNDNLGKLNSICQSLIT